jgi:UDP-2-acetamido-3-amino-2,3-dideoxy-glucuronate N-acetyltransferase
VLQKLGALESVCDGDALTLAKVTAEWPDVVGYSSFVDLLAHSDAEAVVIATPARTHCSVALEALADGRSVLIEKPVTLSTADAVRIARARRPPQIVTSGHLLLHHPAFVVLQQLCDEGELGDVEHVSSKRQSPGRRRSGESVLWSFGPHDVSMMVSLLGMPTSAGCRTEPAHQSLADIAEIKLRFPGGQTADISLSWVHAEKIQRLVISGRTGSAIFDDRLPLSEKLSLIKDGSPRYQDLEDTEPLAAQAVSFLEALDMQRWPLADEVSAWQVAAILGACERSAAAGGRCVAIERPPIDLAGGNDG